MFPVLLQGTYRSFGVMEVATTDATAHYARGFDGRAELQVRNVTPVLRTTLERGVAPAVAELCDREREMHAKAMYGLLARLGAPDRESHPVRVHTDAVMQMQRGFEFDGRVLAVDGEEHLLTIRHRPREGDDDRALAAALLGNAHRLRIRQVEALYRRILEAIIQDRSRN